MPQAPTAKTRSYEALAAALSESPGKPTVDSQGYAATWRENLVPSIDASSAARIEQELGAGGGSELKKKFRAAHSSAALAVNSFVRWLDEASFALSEQVGFTHCSLERKFPTGLGGQPPNLDIAAQSPSHLVAVESKCTEYLSPKSPRFKDSYSARVLELAHQSWRQRFEDLHASKSRTHLDTAQLMKHYLGIRNYLLDPTRRRPAQATLLYLYWLPGNWETCGFDAFEAHRKEVEAFSHCLEDPMVDFKAMSYIDLWSAWETLEPAPNWLPELLQQLTQRYLVEI